MFSVLRIVLVVKSAVVSLGFKVLACILGLVELKLI